MTTTLILNTSLIVLSLKYINVRYENISNVSKWIFDELIKTQYKDSKLSSALNRLDLESIDLLIKLNRDKRVVNDLFIYTLFKNKFQNNLLEIIDIFINNNVDIHMEDELILMQSSRFGYYEAIQFLIDNGVNIRANNDEALRLASYNSHFKICDLLIKNGADRNNQTDDLSNKLN